MRGAIVRVTKEENACPWDTNTRNGRLKKEEEEEEEEKKKLTAAYECFH